MEPDSLQYQLQPEWRHQLPGCPIKLYSGKRTIILDTPSKAATPLPAGYNAPSGGSKVTQITKGSTGNITLYARWAANTDTAYKVNHYQQNIEDAATP
jgi:uncharacterized repeat protein (TIGR02543 family)